MTYNLKAHLAAAGEYTDAIGDDGYFNDFIAARDPMKGFIYAPEEEQDEQQEEEFDDYD